MDFEVADIMNKVDMYELACKTTRNLVLTREEQDARDALDAYFKKVGKEGHDPQHEIAAFVTKVVNEEVYNYPDELIDMLFDRDSIGAYDDYEAVKLPPKNTLVAHEAAFGGNVERSYLDINALQPRFVNYQLETDLSFADIERGGWKTVALLTEYAVAALKNKLFQVIFDVVDSAIVAGAENYIFVTSTLPTEVAMQQAALYIQDRADGSEGAFIARSKYVQAISLFPTFVSQEMMNEVHRTGRLGMYQGVSLYPISSAKKLGDGSGLIMDNRIFGIAGKIGTLTMKGDIKTYQTEDVNKEVVHLLFKNFTFGYAFNKDTLENVVKVVLQ